MKINKPCWGSKQSIDSSKEDMKVFKILETRLAPTQPVSLQTKSIARSKQHALHEAEPKLFSVSFIF